MQHLSPILLVQCYVLTPQFNTFRTRQNGRQLPDYILKCIFLNEIYKFRLTFHRSLKQWLLVYWHIYASLGLNWLINHIYIYIYICIAVSVSKEMVYIFVYEATSNDYVTYTEEQLATVDSTSKKIYCTPESLLLVCLQFGYPSQSNGYTLGASMLRHSLR